MSRVFAYCRVSTPAQSIQPQLDAMREAGHRVTPGCAYSDVASGTGPFFQRPGLLALLDAIDPGDTLVIAGIHRIARNRAEVHGVLRKLDDARVRIIALDAGDVNGLLKSGNI